MNQTHIGAFWLVLVVVAGLFSCSGKPKAAENSAAIRVVVAIAPLKSLIEPMLPAGADVFILTQSPSAPLATELSPAQMNQALSADLLVLVSDDGDPMIHRLTQARSQANKLTVALLDPMATAASQTPWLHPKIVEPAIARFQIAAKRLLEQHDLLTQKQSARIDQAAARITRDVREVDGAYRIMLSALRHHPVVSIQGVFDGLLQSYGLVPAAPLTPNQDTEPSPQVIDRIARMIAADPTLVVIADTTASSAFAQHLERLSNIVVAHLDPIGTGDWEHLMRANLGALIRASTATR